MAESQLVTERRALRRFDGDFAWDGVETLVYKEEGEAPFSKITRQLLHSDSGLDCELRFFDIEAGGHSTLERHQHVHAVMILHGEGECLVGDEVYQISPNDLVTVPAMEWHQFKANAGTGLGFLCMVNRERDRPQLPSESELAQLRKYAQVASFLDS